MRLATGISEKESAPPVLCFQHFTGTMNNFDPIHTNRLAQDRPVILVDYRGVGRSSGEMPDSIPATAKPESFIAFVTALGLKEIDLFGFSIGGMVAQQVALDAPELVRRHPPRWHRPVWRAKACMNFRLGCWKSSIDRTAPSRNARWIYSFEEPDGRLRGRQGLAQAWIAARKRDREPEAEAPGRRGPACRSRPNEVRSRRQTARR